VRPLAARAPAAASRHARPAQMPCAAARRWQPCLRSHTVTPCCADKQTPPAQGMHPVAWVHKRRQ
jgi:hypothetical protein